MFQIDPAPISIADGCRDRDDDMVGADSALEPLIEGPLSTRGINIARIETKLDLIKEATKTLPINEFNLPVYIFRSDMLYSSNVEKIDEMLTAATVYINYHHGYPTIKDDEPFWGKFEWENQNCFNAFLSYLSQEGVRIPRNVTEFSPDLTASWFHEYYWGPRALAYDMYMAAHHLRMKEKRIFEVENTHYGVSKKIFNRFAAKFENMDDAKIDAMEPDKLMKVMVEASRLQRVSAGLSPNGDMKGGFEPKSSQVEVTMRKIAETTGVHATNNDDMDLSQVYNDPEAMRVLQETIIKVTR